MDKIKENNTGLGWEGLLKGTLSAVNESYDRAEGSYRDAAAKYQQAIDGQVPLLQLMQQSIGQKREVDEQSENKKRSVALLTDSLRTIGQMFNSAVGGNVVGYKPLDVESDIAKKRAEIQAFNDGYDRMAFQTAMQDRQDGLKNRLNGINMDMKIGELQAERGKAVQKAVLENAKLQRQAEKDAAEKVYKDRMAEAAWRRAQNGTSEGASKGKKYFHPYTNQPLTEEQARRVYMSLYGSMRQLDNGDSHGTTFSSGDNTREYTRLDDIVNLVLAKKSDPYFKSIWDQVEKYHRNYSGGVGTVAAPATPAKSNVKTNGYFPKKS